jgi:hypothetical protein
MRTPGFTAEASLGSTKRTYRSKAPSRSGNGGLPGGQVLPSATRVSGIGGTRVIGGVSVSPFACGQDQCICHGSGDCIDLFLTGLCDWNQEVTCTGEGDATACHCLRASHGPD